MTSLIQRVTGNLRLAVDASIDIFDLIVTRVPPFEKLPTCQDQVWIVTGANSGIGLQVAQDLARRNAKVWLAARNEERLQAAISNIKNEVPHARVDYFVIDLADLKSVKPAVAKFLAAEKKLHGVIHNAGAMLPSGTSPQGYDQHLAINNLGPQLLQDLLNDILLETAKGSAPGRIVWVASLAHAASPFPGGANFEDPTDLGPYGADGYCVSKAINIMQAVQWTLHHPDANVVSVAVHPGLIGSPLYRNAGFVETIVSRGGWSAEFGAYAELFAALGPLTPGDIDESYVVPVGRIGQPRRDVLEAAKSPSQGGRLWKWMEAACRPYR